MFSPANCSPPSSVAHVPASQLSDAELVAGMAEQLELKRRAEARLAELAAESATRLATVRECGLTTEQWLGRYAGVPGAAARRFVGVARTVVEGLPATFAAWAEGRISTDHAATLSDLMNERVRERLQVMEHAFIADACSNTTFESWQARTRDVVNTLDEDGPFDPRAEDREQRNSLSIKDRPDGSIRVTGHFHGDTAAIVKEQLERLGERVWHRHREDRKRIPELQMPGWNQCLAQGLVDALSAKAGADGAPLVTLRMNTNEPGAALALTGQRLAGAELGRLLGADCRFRPLVENSRGVPLWYGNEVRFATPDQREVGLLRDGGCVFPGCTAPGRWVQLHHTFPHGLGGPSSITYYACLCDHHHRGTIHRRGWVMWPEQDESGPTGWFIIEAPNGRRMYSQRHGKQPDHPPPDTPAPAWVQLVVGRRQ